jgi:hypothetical protein
MDIILSKLSLRYRRFTFVTFPPTFIFSIGIIAWFRIRYPRQIVTRADDWTAERPDIMENVAKSSVEILTWSAQTFYQRLSTLEPSIVNSFLPIWFEGCFYCTRSLQAVEKRKQFWSISDKYTFWKKQFWSYFKAFARYLHGYRYHSLILVKRAQINQ